MVQRKRVRKKPKDPADLSEDGLPAASGGMGGGGAATGRPSLPNYMRPTSSYGAKVGRASRGEAASAAPPERKTVRAKVVFTGTPYVSRATCSSTMKGAERAAEGRVCPYTYCSLKGHVHASVVPVRGFLASQRRLIKTQQSMKLKGVSPFSKTKSGGGRGDGFFVEIYNGAGAGTTATTVGFDGGGSDLSTEEMDAMVRRMENVMFDHRSYRYAEDRVKDPAVSVDGSCGSSDVISDGLAELFSTTKPSRCKEFDEDEEASVDQEAEDFGACKSDISEELNAKDEGNISQDRGSSIDEISSAFGGMNFKDGSDPTNAATSQRNKMMISRRETPKEGEQMRPFNPRKPNFLPIEPGPDVEKIDLRHQTADDRKSAEEWMVDYALRRAVNKLARAQKRKVEMLVQAFETVLPPAPDDKKSVQQDDDKKNFTQARPWQSCS